MNNNKSKSKKSVPKVPDQETQHFMNAFNGLSYAGELSR